MTEEDFAEALSGWHPLQKHISKATEAETNELLKREMAGARRRLFLLRIHSRLNKVRATREREELKRMGK